MGKCSSGLKESFWPRFRRRVLRRPCDGWLGLELDAGLSAVRELDASGLKGPLEGGNRSPFRSAFPSLEFQDSLLVGACFEPQCHLCPPKQLTRGFDHAGDHVLVSRGRTTKRMDIGLPAIAPPSASVIETGKHLSKASAISFANLCCST